MADELDALLAELPSDTDVSVPAVEPAAQPDPQPEAPTVKFAELDAVIPDAPDVPEAYRSKLLADVIRVAEQHKHEAGVAAQRNQEWNRMAARAQTAEAMIEFLKQQNSNAHAQSQQQPGETRDQWIARLSNEPDRVLPELIQQHTAPLQQQLRNLETLAFRQASDGAQIQAREALNIDREKWSAIQAPVAAMMHANNWPATDPAAWYEAARRYIEVARQFAPPPAAPPPPVEVPRQAAPPTGSARSQSRPTTGVKLRSHVKSASDDMAAAFGFDQSKKAEFEAFLAERAATGGGEL